MEDFFGFNIGLYINNSSVSPAPNQYSFVISDNIHSAFPKLILNFSDISGMFMEFGDFTQGVPLNIKYGIIELSNMIDCDFRSSSRNTISPVAGSPGLNGNLTIDGLHDSFFENRDAPYKAFKEMPVSDVIKELFTSEENLMIEATKGKIETYVFDDPYKFTRNILLPMATNGKIYPYIFFRNLLGELHFESLNILEERAPVEKLSFGGDINEDNAYNILNSFLPFNEDLEKTLIKFHTEGKILKNDLSFTEEEKSVATDAKDLIPLIGNTRIHNDQYFHRQFNPKVEYEQINNAFYANKMRASFFIDKAMGVLPYHPNLVAGKTVEIDVSILDTDNKAELAETFSGKWLIEQSIHSWDGSGKRGQTQLILCRSSMKPRRDSILMDRSFRD